MGPIHQDAGLEGTAQALAPSPPPGAYLVPLHGSSTSGATTLLLVVSLLSP